MTGCSRADARRWAQFSEAYEQKVVSLTSFERMRGLLLREMAPGVSVDLGCGPLGLLARDLCRSRQARVVACDFCWEMVAGSRRRFEAANLLHVVADNRELPLAPVVADTVFSVNSFLPETRADAELMFAEAARILRPGGRLVAVLPAFEMSLVARDVWGMRVEVDVEGRREFDTSGWQCFYTEADIAGLAARHQFGRYRISRVLLAEPDEIAHVREVYEEQLVGVDPGKLEKFPLFEHLLVAER